MTADPWAALLLFFEAHDGHGTMHHAIRFPPDAAQPATIRLTCMCGGRGILQCPYSYAASLLRQLRTRGYEPRLAGVVPGVH
jgi:hypothetical protein